MRFCLIRVSAFFDYSAASTDFLASEIDFVILCSASSRVSARTISAIWRFHLSSSSGSSFSLILALISSILAVLATFLMAPAPFLPFLDLLSFFLLVDFLILASGTTSSE